MRTSHINSQVSVGFGTLPSPAFLRVVDHPMEAIYHKGSGDWVMRFARIVHFQIKRGKETQPACKVPRAGSTRMRTPFVLAAITAVVCLMAPAFAFATPLSFGCNFLNDPIFDGVHSNFGVSTVPFFAGETITVTAGQPVVLGFGTLTGITLQLNDISLVFTTPWDGISPPSASLAYTFTSNQSTNVNYGLFPSVVDTATWTVSCAHSFAGVVGLPNCHGQSVAALNATYGSLCAAATALGFVLPGGGCDLPALQAAIMAYCQ